MGIISRIKGAFSRKDKEEKEIGQVEMKERQIDLAERKKRIADYEQQRRNEKEMTIRQRIAAYKESRQRKREPMPLPGPIREQAEERRIRDIIQHKEEAKRLKNAERAIEKSARRREMYRVTEEIAAPFRKARRYLAEKHITTPTQEERQIYGRIQRALTKQVPYQKEGKTYYRTEVRGARPPSIRVAQRLAEFAGQRLPVKYQGKKGYAGRGRPRGASGKYIIPGKGAVGVYEYRKWARYQRRLASMTQQQQLAQMMARNPQLARYYAQTGQLPPQVQQPQIMAQPIDNQPPHQIQTAQSGPALVGSWDLLKLKMPSFQNPAVPNSPMNVFRAESPVTNPGGEYYTEPDFMTGRQVLKRRNLGGFGLW